MIAPALRELPVLLLERPPVLPVVGTRTDPVPEREPVGALVTPRRL